MEIPPKRPKKRMKQKPLTPWQQKIKETLIANGGSVTKAAVELDRSVITISEALNRGSLYLWWRRHKFKIAKERACAKSRRAYYRRKERLAEQEARQTRRIDPRDVIARVAAEHGISVEEYLEMEAIRLGILQ